MLIRKLRADDRPAVVEMLTACGAFSAEEICVALELVDAGLVADEYDFSDLNSTASHAATSASDRLR